VHSRIEFQDGSTLAQASPPDMRLTIALGLSWPDRIASGATPCDWTAASTWEFLPLDNEVFRAVELARHAVGASATHPAVYNAANELCVAAFLDSRIGYLDIVSTVEKVLGLHEPETGTVTLEQVLQTERWARAQADRLLARI